MRRSRSRLGRMAYVCFLLASMWAQGGTNPVFSVTCQPATNGLTVCVNNISTNDVLVEVPEFGIEHTICYAIAGENEKGNPSRVTIQRSSFRVLDGKGAGAMFAPWSSLAFNIKCETEGIARLSVTVSFLPLPELRHVRSAEGLKAALRRESHLLQVGFSKRDAK